jgi:hypothetical protein
MNSKAIQAYNEAIEKQETAKIKELLQHNNINGTFSIDFQGYIKIIIDNGHWKHDHLELQKVMREAGYISFGRHIPDEQEDSDDTFSAVYLYR